MAETLVYTPENQANNALPWLMAGQNNGGLLGGAGGAAFLGGLLGGIFPNLFGWGYGGWGNGGMNGAAASLGAQATANSNTDLIMQAINGTDADVRQLATANNADFNAVKSELCSLNTAAATLGAQIGMTGQQVINSILTGDANLASQLCQCCCEMKQLVTSQGYENQLRTVEQTNTLGTAIAGSGQRTVDAIADLKTTMVKEFCDVKEREMQEKINSLTANNTLLRSQIDNANQTAQIAALIAPIAQEVDDIKCKLPSTVSVNYPNLMAVNTTPYVSGGYYGMQPNFGWGNGFFGNGFGGF